MGAFGKSFAALLLGTSLAIPAPSGRAQSGSGDVELELVLAVDSSASVDSDEFDLQLFGMARAFRDPEVVAAIEAQGQLGIAVAMVQWSSYASLVVGWARLTNAAEAEAFAAAIERAPRRTIGVTTGIGSALSLSSLLLASNDYRGRRQVIDISGDGKNNSGLPLWVERNRAFEAGITVNGLAILDEDPTLESYYANHVIGGPGAFLVMAEDFDDFARAFREKLLRELTSLVSSREGAPRTQAAGVSGASR